MDNRTEKVKMLTQWKHMLQFETKVRWRNVFILAIVHLAALYGAYLMAMEAKFATFLSTNLFGVFASLGITAGAHRLFAHKSYKADLPLRILFAFFNLFSLQGDIYAWCRNHRMHHKFLNTDADPHNSNRGFFFAHVGWLLCAKHPEVLKKGATVSFEDLLREPVVYFQREFYIVFSLLAVILIQIAIPVYFWGESWRVALFSGVILRAVYLCHCTWLGNSVFHLDSHNVDHSSPFDYSTAELDPYERFNLATMFIVGCAALGQVTNRKGAIPSMIEARAQDTGDGKEHENVAKISTKFSVLRFVLESFINPSIFILPWVIGVLFLR